MAEACITLTPYRKEFFSVHGFHKYPNHNVTSTMMVMSSSGLQMATSYQSKLLLLTVPPILVPDCSESDNEIHIHAEVTSETELLYVPSSPCGECGKAGVSTKNNKYRYLDIFESSLTTLVHLVKDPSPASRATVLYYPSSAPVARHDN